MKGYPAIFSWLREYRATANQSAAKGIAKKTEILRESVNIVHLMLKRNMFSLNRADIRAVMMRKPNVNAEGRKKGQNRPGDDM